MTTEKQSIWLKFKPLTLAIDKSLWLKFKSKVNRDITLNDKVVELIKQFVENAS